VPFADALVTVTLEGAAEARTDAQDGLRPALHLEDQDLALAGEKVLASHGLFVICFGCVVALVIPAGWHSKAAGFQAENVIPSVF
jgi:hypothetical protein